MSEWAFESKQVYNDSINSYYDVLYRQSQNGHRIQDQNLNNHEQSKLLSYYLSQNFLQQQQIAKQSGKNDHDVYMNHENSKQTKIPQILTPQNLSQDYLQSQQNKHQQMLSQKQQIQRAKFNAYYQGHLDYYATLKLPIFGLSRKYKRPRRRAVSQFDFMKRRFNRIKGYKKTQIQHVKRIDQSLFDQFQLLSLQDRQNADITQSALRYLEKNIQKKQNKQILQKNKAKYGEKEHWAQYLSGLVRQKGQQQDELNFDPNW